MHHRWLRPLPWGGFLLPYVQFLHAELTHLTKLLSPAASGYQCFRDSTNTPKCSPSSSGVQPSLTNTNVDTNSSTVTFVSPSTISLTQGPSTVVLPSTTSTFSRTTFFPSPSSPSPSTTSGNAGLTSSALPVGVDTLLNLLAGVGVFAYLF